MFFSRINIFVFLVAFSSLIVQNGLTNGREVEDIKEVEYVQKSGNEKVLKRQKRREGTLIENLVGIWVPVYIPQSETAFNDFRDELPKYNPPKPHYHQVNIVYSFCLTQMFFC